MSHIEIIKKKNRGKRRGGDVRRVERSIGLGDANKKRNYTKRMHQQMEYVKFYAKIRTFTDNETSSIHRYSIPITRLVLLQ